MRTSRTIIHTILAAGLLAGLTATAAHADDGGVDAYDPEAAKQSSNEVTIGSTARSLRAGSANAITEDGMASFTATYARDVGIPVIAGIRLEAEVGFDRGFATGVSFMDLAGDLDTTELTAGVRGRRPLRWGVGATARAAVGLARTDLHLERMYSPSDSIDDAHWGTLAKAAVGLDLSGRPGFSKTLELGLRAELGYTLASAVEMHAVPSGSGDDGTITIPTEHASLGELDTSGYTFHVAFFSRF